MFDAILGIIADWGQWLYDHPRLVLKIWLSIGAAALITVGAIMLRYYFENPRGWWQ